MKKLLFAVTALAMIAVSCKDIQEEIEMEVGTLSLPAAWMPTKRLMDGVSMPTGFRRCRRVAAAGQKRAFLRLKAVKPEGQRAGGGQVNLKGDPAGG